MQQYNMVVVSFSLSKSVAMPWWGEKVIAFASLCSFGLCLPVHARDYSLPGFDAEFANTHPSAAHDHSQFCRARSHHHTLQHCHCLRLASHCGSLSLSLSLSLFVSFSLSLYLSVSHSLSLSLLWACAPPHSHKHTPKMPVICVVLS